MDMHQFFSMFRSMDTIIFDETIEEQAMNIHAFIYLSSSLFLSDFSSSSDCGEEKKATAKNGMKSWANF